MHELSSSNDIEVHLLDVQNRLQAFRDSHRVNFIVSISGGAEEHNIALAQAGITELMAELQNSNCAILTGGTKGGIPEMGTKMARAYGIPTIGVFPPKAHKYALLEDLDLPIETLPPSLGPASFGSETPSFAQLPDYAVFIGGSYGTLAEAATIMKVNTKRKKDKVEPIYICPLHGSEGVTDLIPMLVQIEPNLAFCLPEYVLTTGTEIGQFINTNYQNKQK